MAYRQPFRSGLRDLAEGLLRESEARRQQRYLDQQMRQQEREIQSQGVERLQEAVMSPLNAVFQQRREDELITRQQSFETGKEMYSTAVTEIQDIRDVYERALLANSQNPGSISPQTLSELQAAVDAYSLVDTSNFAELSNALSNARSTVVRQGIDGAPFDPASRPLTAQRAVSNIRAELDLLEQNRAQELAGQADVLNRINFLQENLRWGEGSTVFSLANSVMSAENLRRILSDPNIVLPQGFQREALEAELDTFDDWFESYDGKEEVMTFVEQERQAASMRLEQQAADLAGTQISNAIASEALAQEVINTSFYGAFMQVDYDKSLSELRNMDLAAIATEQGIQATAADLDQAAILLFEETGIVNTGREEVVRNHFNRVIKPGLAQGTTFEQFQQDRSTLHRQTMDDERALVTIAKEAGILNLEGVELDNRLATLQVSTEEWIASRREFDAANADRDRLDEKITQAMIMGDTAYLNEILATWDTNGWSRSGITRQRIEAVLVRANALETNEMRKLEYATAELNYGMNQLALKDFGTRTTMASEILNQQALNMTPEQFQAWWGGLNDGDRALFDENGQILFEAALGQSRFNALIRQDEEKALAFNTIAPLIASIPDPGPNESNWNTHLATVRQSLVDAGIDPDEASAYVSGLRGDWQRIYAAERRLDNADERADTQLQQGILQFAQEFGLRVESFKRENFESDRAHQLAVSRTNLMWEEFDQRVFESEADRALAREEFELRLEIFDRGNFESDRDYELAIREQDRLDVASARAGAQHRLNMALGREELELLNMDVAARRNAADNPPLYDAEQIKLLSDLNNSNRATVKSELDDLADLYETQGCAVAGTTRFDTLGGQFVYQPPPELTSAQQATCNGISFSITDAMGRYQEIDSFGQDLIDVVLGTPPEQRAPLAFDDVIDAVPAAGRDIYNAFVEDFDNGLFNDQNGNFVPTQMTAALLPAIEQYVAEFNLSSPEEADRMVEAIRSEVAGKLEGLMVERRPNVTGSQTIAPRSAPSTPIDVVAEATGIPAFLMRAIPGVSSPSNVANEKLQDLMSDPTAFATFMIGSIPGTNFSNAQAAALQDAIQDADTRSDAIAGLVAAAVPGVDATAAEDILDRLMDPNLLSDAGQAAAFAGDAVATGARDVGASVAGTAADVARAARAVDEAASVIPPVDNPTREFFGPDERETPFDANYGLNQLEQFNIPVETFKDDYAFVDALYQTVFNGAPMPAEMSSVSTEDRVRELARKYNIGIATDGSQFDLRAFLQRFNNVYGRAYGAVNQ